MTNNMQANNQPFAHNQSVRIPNPQGWHARPATKLSKLVKTFSEPVRLIAEDGRSIDPSRMMAILSLGLTQNAQITVSSDNAQAVEEIVKAIESGLGDDLNEAGAPSSAQENSINSKDSASSQNADSSSKAMVEGKYAYAQLVRIPNPQGWHARPATRLTKLVKQLNVPVSLTTQDGQTIDLAKMMDVLALGLTQHAQVVVSSDNERVLEKVVEAIKEGLGDDLQANHEIQQDTAKNNDGLWQAPEGLTMFEGVGASTGLAIGQVHLFGQTQYEIPTQSDSPLMEARKLDEAISAAARDIHSMIDEVSDELSADKAAIFDAHLELLQDEEIIEETVGLINEGKNAAQAYLSVSNARIQMFTELSDAHLAARSADMLDVRERVMRALLGVKAQSLNFSSPVVLVAEDLTPSDTARLNPDQVLAMITEKGGATSHSAIIARGMGIPAVVGLENALTLLAQDSTVVVDGSNGRVYLEPNAEQLQSAEQAQKAFSEKLNVARQSRHKAGQTADGEVINISANINRADGVEGAIDSGAEGVGLMRTEFLYLEREQIPSEEEQEAEYREMAKALDGRPLIIRTLDIGGDKEVAYLNLRHEDNAFLGIRGIRLCFERPDLFKPQLRAICKVAKDYDNVHVMFPMIATAYDWRRAKQMLDEVRESLQAPKFPVGIMIEVPSAALKAQWFAQEVDFFSVGTNDLTQYTLAMDRMHPQLAKQADALEPSVLRLIAMTCEAAKAHGKWVGVCGGAAGDETAAKVLVGLGVRELSMSINAIASIKQVLRQHNLKDLERVAKEALTLTDAKAVRSLLIQELS